MLFFLDFFSISYDIISMKKAALLCIIAGIALFGCGEADTVMPGDKIYHTDSEPEGEVTSITAAVICTTETNPVVPIDSCSVGTTNPPVVCCPPTVTNPIITIDFSTPVAGDSILYDTSIRVSMWNGTAYAAIPKNNGSNDGYYATPDNPTLNRSYNSIRIDLSAKKPIANNTRILITLTSTIKAYGGDSITLSNPGDFERVVIPKLID